MTITTLTTVTIRNLKRRCQLEVAPTRTGPLSGSDTCGQTRGVEPRSIREAWRRLAVVQLTPLRGTQADEEQRGEGIQDRVVRDNRPSDILRHRMLQIAQREPDAWRRLPGHFEEMFQDIPQK